MKYSLKTKLLISLFSFIFFLSILEISLWMIGRIYYTPDNDYRLTDYENLPDGGNKKEYQKIICVGDSYTHGGMVESDETYPALLHFYIKDQHPDAKVMVLNKGICEANTREVLEALPSVIRETSPDMVILLAGSANRFNPWDFERYRSDGIVSRVNSWFHDLRVVKMFRFIKLTLFMRSSAPSLPSVRKNTLLRNLMPQRNPRTFHDAHLAYLGPLKKIHNREGSPLERIWSLYNDGNKGAAIKLAEESLNSDGVASFDIKLALSEFYLQSGEIDKAKAVLEALNEEYPGSPGVYNALTYFYFESALKLKNDQKFAEAIRSVLKAVELDPSADYFYYELNRLYEVQSYYNSVDIYNALNKMQDDDPLLKMNSLFDFHLKIYKDKMAWDEGIKGWIGSDLEEIVKLCREKNVHLIIQNYPAPHTTPNEILVKIAGKHGLPFVDQLSAFNRVNDIKEYLYDDDHCTPKGHQLMAENLYQKLISLNLLKTH